MRERQTGSQGEKAEEDSGRETARYPPNRLATNRTFGVMFSSKPAHDTAPHRFRIRDGMCIHGYQRFPFLGG
jgi:hypothetical protein